MKMKMHMLVHRFAPMGLVGGGRMRMIQRCMLDLSVSRIYMCIASLA